jgi:hypothetical protein
MNIASIMGIAVRSRDEDSKTERSRDEGSKYKGHISARSRDEDSKTERSRDEESCPQRE